MALKYPAVPEPTLVPESLRDSILSIKQVLEVLTGQRGNANYSAVTPPDLANINSGITDNAADIAANTAAIATKVSKAGDIMSGPLRVNGGIHNWPLNVKAGPDINVGFIDGTGGKVILGNINDAGTTWTPLQINSPLGVANHVTPTVTATYHLGSTSLRWHTVYTADLDLNNGIGDWTIVEGEDDLFIYNNKKNKVYKFLLYEVTPETAPPKKA